MKAYTVDYTMTQYGEEKQICFLAENKEDAFDKAIFEEIPKAEGRCPYMVRVVGVTYQNGNYKRFN